MTMHLKPLKDALLLEFDAASHHSEEALNRAGSNRTIPICDQAEPHTESASLFEGVDADLRPTESGEILVVERSQVAPSQCPELTPSGL